EKAEQEAKARTEAEEKAKSEAAARVKAQAQAKAAAEKAGAKTELEEVVAEQGRADKNVIDIEDLEDLTQTSATEDETEKTEAAGVTLQGGTDNKAEKEIPRFNLAQQILAEQRRIASGRRSKSTEPGRGTSIRPAIGTIGRIIREAKKAPVGDNEAVESGLHLSFGVYGVIDGFDNLKPTQQQVVADIVTSDISRLCVDDERRRDGL
ncbi:MAG TPA: hypothetical protein HPP51_03895, partial [Planctomycetes bacterium]|nr:hypothetical protein [Planctomycetota bacterium]